MTNKTLSINPSLFNVGGLKTKKNREKKQKTVITPLISPNVLKKKLLSRIKEHKQRETSHLENNTKGGKPVEESAYKASEALSTSTSGSFSDEFSDSLNYLQMLNEDKKKQEKQIKDNVRRQEHKNNINQMTVKNYKPSSELITDHPGVNIDLPEELSHPLVSVKTDLPPTISEPLFLKTHTSDSVPYGILKGGIKPTYRNWNRTQRNNPSAQVGHEKTDRENRLDLLRKKLLQKESHASTHNDNIMMSQNLIQTSIANEPVVSITTDVASFKTDLPGNDIIGGSNQIVQPQIEGPLNKNEQIIATKRTTTKTIKRKYTLGKSRIRKTVAVLIKDRGTRKKVLAAQKDLKRKGIDEIKGYLRDHNLLKIGSNAPNDIIRKLYESAMLAGEITNNNAETLLHNFSKSDKEL
ncbi:MAG: hypothetical protein MUP82_04120 [Candidatus Marinimicrobia bacterium]|nr:hypothetical protein [Candidatus Neomarinimicrobiota bacterium]